MTSSSRGKWRFALEIIGVVLVAAGVVAGFLQWRAAAEGVDVQRRALVAEFSPALRLSLSNVLRASLNSGRRPSVDDPEVAQFLAAHHLSPESVRQYLDELTARAHSAATQITRGQEAASRGDLTAAHEAFARATDDDPTNAYAWANLGAAAELLHKPIDARHAYEQALSIDPSNWLAHYNLGCHLARNHQTDGALAQIRQAIELFHDAARTPAEWTTMMRRIRADDALQDLRDDPRFQRLFAD